jgi:hypothetical protein
MWQSLRFERVPLLVGRTVRRRRLRTLPLPLPALMKSDDGDAFDYLGAHGSGSSYLAPPTRAIDRTYRGLAAILGRTILRPSELSAHDQTAHLSLQQHALSLVPQSHHAHDSWGGAVTGSIAFEVIRDVGNSR